jgi:hypothetical protein
VITPRESDRTIVNEIHNKSIVFITWQDIAGYLEQELPENIIVDEFIEYGNSTGEFTIMKEISESEIEIIANWYKYNIPVRLWYIYNTLSEDIVGLFKEFNINVESVKTADHWGRQGIEIYFLEPKIGIWAFYGLYYQDTDHKIPFVNKGIPDITLFFDLNDEKEKIDGNKDIVLDFKNLEKYGFKCNDNGRLTKNRWRLISYQKSLKDFKGLSREGLKEELRSILRTLTEKSETFVKYL